MPRSAYDRSKGVESVTWREFPLGKGIALTILDETTAAGRQARGQALLDVLDEAAGLPPCKLTVADRPQRHRTREGKLEVKTYGYYRIAWESTPQRGSIRIYNLTAIRQQVLAPKVSPETLGVGFVAPPKREVSSAAPPDDVTVGKDHLRPGGIPPPKWIRDQVLALFGHPRS